MQEGGRIALPACLSAWLPACLAALALTAAGCAGGGTGDADDARPLGISATLRAALAALDARDHEALCDTLSRKGRLVVGFAQHGSLPIECPEDIDRYLGALRPYGNGRRPRLTAVRRPAPGRAVAVFRLPGGMRATIALRREGGAWKLDGLFDGGMAYMQLRLASSRDPQPVPEERLLIDEPPDPLEPSGGVTVRDAASGRPCPAVELDRYPELSGGCAMKLAGTGVRITLQTPFGFMRFGRCRIEHELRVDGGGRAWVAGYAIAGDSPCFDATPCRYASEDDQTLPGGRTIRGLAPWSGRIEPGPGGAPRLTFDDACFDTCIGRFSGPWSQELAEGRDGWRLRSGSMVGTSGWRVDGALSARGRPIAIDIAPRPPAGAPAAAATGGTSGVESPTAIAGGGNGDR